MKKIYNIGIIGAGHIAGKMARTLAQVKETNVLAVGSRTLEKAQSFAQEFGVERAYGSYEEVFQDQDVDLVYIATPHPLHPEQAKLMMRHGKHVLCEKPMTVNDREAEEMIACARENGVFLMEAMWSRFMPANVKAKELIDGGAIGTVRHLCGNFSYPGRYDESDRVYALEMAGGALLDLGVYPLMEITFFLGWQPEKVTGYAVKAPNGTDMRFCGQMLYPSGATAQFFCGMDAGADQRMMVYGSEGYLEIEDFWHATKLILHKWGGEDTVYQFPAENEGHHYEFDHAARCIRQGRKESPSVSWEESLAVSRISTELRKETGILYPMDQF